MKKYLLDTHIVLWLMFDINKVSYTILNEIKNPDNEIFISAASIWEISIKYNLGKLSLNKFKPSDLFEIYSSQGFKFIPISIDEVSSFYKLDNNYHKDPFDRMLVWQAISNKYTLITNDINMKPYKVDGLKLLW